MILSRKSRAVFVEPTGHAYGQNDYQQMAYVNEQNPQFLLYNGMHNQTHSTPQYHNHHHHHHQSPTYPQSYFNPYSHQSYQQHHLNSDVNFQMVPQSTSVPPDPFCSIEPMETNVQAKVS